MAPENTLDKLRRAIDGAEVVSFDVFDTVLLRRLFRPDDLFELIEGSESLGFNFREVRAYAEREANRKKREAGGTEITLDEIYAELSQLPMPGFSQGKAGRLKSLELEYEERVCFANPFFVPAYAQAVKSGKRIIFCSDMYLSERHIAGLLRKNGFRHWDRIFVSSEAGVSKRSGRLFDAVLRELGVEGRKMLHIGDHPVSDVAMPAKRGIRTFYYEKCSSLALKDRRFRSLARAFSPTELGHPMVSAWLGALASGAYALRPAGKRDFFHDLGLFYGGMLITGFVDWIQREASRAGVEEIFFLSRDGYLPERVYQRLRGLGKRAPRARYLYASRKVFVLSSLDQSQVEAVDFMTQINPGTPLSSYFDRLNLDPVKYLEKMRAAGFEGPEQVLKRSDRQKLGHLFSLVNGEIEEGNRSLRKKLVRYLGQNGVLKAKRIAFVDVGWQGSLQKAYEALAAGILRKKQTVVGYYLGLWKISDFRNRRWIRDVEGMWGYLTHFGNPKSNNLQLGWPLFELLLYAPHGTLVGLDEKKSKIVPRLDRNDSAVNQKSAARIHDGVEAFVSSLLPMMGLFEFDKALIVKPIDRLICNPSQEEAKNIGSFEMGSFGVGANLKPIAKPPSVFGIAALWRGFRESHWKPGFWRQIPMTGFLPNFFWFSHYVKKNRKFFSGVLNWLRRR